MLEENLKDFCGTVRRFYVRSLCGDLIKTANTAISESDESQAQSWEISQHGTARKLKDVKLFHSMF